MKRSPRTLPLAALLLSLLAANLALGKSGQEFNFLNEKSLDPVQLLAEPVKPNTPEFKLELETVLKLQETRTPEETARAMAEKKFDVFAFQGAIGEWFTAGNLPLTEKLFKKIDKDSKFFSTRAKDAFARQRPGKTDERVKPLMDDADASYPSGHSTRGTLMAEVLAGLLPDKKTAIIERGQQIGWDRVIAGVHFPSDVAAGRVLGKALARELMANPAFAAELTQVKEEIAHAAMPQPAAAAAH